MTNFNDELHIVLVWRIETFVASSIRDWCCQSLQSVWSKNTFLAGLVVKDTLSIEYIDLPATSMRLLQRKERESWSYWKHLLFFVVVFKWTSEEETLVYIVSREQRQHVMFNLNF